jgi:hypothetical protein
LNLFPFFDAHDSRVWSVDGVKKFLHILSQVLNVCLRAISLFFL